MTKCQWYFFYNVNWSCNLYSRRKTCLNKWLVDTVWLITLYRLLPCCWWQSSKHHNCPVLVSSRSVHITDKFSEKKIRLLFYSKDSIWRRCMNQVEISQKERRLCLTAMEKKRKANEKISNFKQVNLRKIVNFKQVLRNLIFVYWK